MIEIWLLVAAFFTGFLRSLVRSLTAKTHILHKMASYVFAVLYGILFTYLISTTNTIVASLWFGLIIALIISNKMTGFAHILGLATVVSILGLQGLEKLNWVFLTVFAIVAIADEFIGNRRHHHRSFKNIGIQFIGLQVIGLFVSLTTGIWMVFFSIVLYDIGFLCIDILLSKQLKKEGQGEKPVKHHYKKRKSDYHHHL